MSETSFTSSDNGSWVSCCGIYFLWFPCYGKNGVFVLLSCLISLPSFTVQISTFARHWRSRSELDRFWSYPHTIYNSVWKAYNNRVITEVLNFRGRWQGNSIEQPPLGFEVREVQWLEYVTRWILTVLTELACECRAIKDCSKQVKTWPTFLPF